MFERVFFEKMFDTYEHVWHITAGPFDFRPDNTMTFFAARHETPYRVSVNLTQFR